MNIDDATAKDMEIAALRAELQNLHKRLVSADIAARPPLTSEDHTSKKVQLGPQSGPQSHSQSGPGPQSSQQNASAQPQLE